jgi:cyanophycinase-like exopeptidase
MKGYVAKAFWGAEIIAFHVQGEPQKMDPLKAQQIVDEADVIFLTGGDPVLGARLLTESGADVWLRDAHAKGTPCLGVSAGAIMLSAWWASWPDEPPPGEPFDGGHLVPCAGVAADLVIDCHAEKDEWAELKIVSAMIEARAHPRLKGKRKLPRRIGITTGSGVIVRAHGGEPDLEWLGSKPFEL